MRTVLIISYWFAPSPAVGAKRFSFLAREFTRLGFDVHVITHDARDDWKTDGSLPVTGHVHRVAAPVKLPLAVMVGMAAPPRSRCRLMVTLLMVPPLRGGTGICMLNLVATVLGLKAALTASWMLSRRVVKVVL